MAPASDRPTPLALLGLDVGAERLYRLALRESPVELTRLASSLGWMRDRLEVEVRRLEGLGLVERHGEAVVAAPPDAALGRVIDEEDRRLRSVQQQLDALREMLPRLAAEHMVAAVPRGEPVGLEVVDPAQLVDLVRGLTARATGELLWLRPDQWRVPESAEIEPWMTSLLRQGRRSRVIYPARALEEAPEALRARAELGEHTRVLADVPGRLAVLGDAAIMRERFSESAGRVVLVRHPALVAALRGYFEELWQRALPVPGLDGEHEATAGARKLLLAQLAAGAKDEQIARTLGLSLRTVRRRVSAVLDELGAASRFQAGVEAVRRGWI